MVIGQLNISVIFCEFLLIRCVWPKLNEFLYDNIYKCAAHNLSKKEKQSDFKQIVAATLVLTYRTF